MSSTSRATHFLVPMPVREALQRMSDETRVSIEDYVREAVSDLLMKYADAAPGPRPRLPPGSMVSVVSRIGAARRAGLKGLVARTRVPQSDLLREAVADVLAKHGHRLEVPALPEPQPAPRGRPPGSTGSPKTTAPRCAFDCGFPLNPEEVAAALSSGDWRCSECRMSA